MRKVLPPKHDTAHPPHRNGTAPKSRPARWLRTVLLALLLIGSGHVDAESIGPLVTQLASPSIEQRYAAIQALGAQGPAAAEAVAELIFCLDRSGDADERRRLIVALGRIGSPPETIVASLLRTASNVEGDAALEAAMLEAIGKMGPDTVPALVVGLQHPMDAGIRRLSLAGLRQLGDAAGQAAPQLGDALADEGLALAAARTLAALGPAAEPAIDDLIAALNRHSDEAVSHAAATALGRIGAPAHPALQPLYEQARHGPARLRAATVVALAAIDPEHDRVAALIVANLEDPDVEVRRAACHAAARLGPAAAAAAPTLIDQLSFDRCRSAAIAALASIGNATVPPLLAVLNDPDRTNIHRATVEVLYHLGPRADDAVTNLVRLLKGDDRYMARDATRALGAIGPAARWSVPAIVAQMTEPDNDIRTAFHMSLQAIGPAGSAAIRPLADLMEHEEAMVRQFAAWSLGRVGGAATVVAPTLVTALDDNHHAVRVWAAWALARMDRHDATKCVPILKAGLAAEDVHIRQACAEALGRIGPAAAPAVGSLIHTMRDADAAVRMWTAWSLGRIGRQAAGAMGPLTMALDDDNAQVRLWAGRSLDRLRGQGAGRDHADPGG